MAKLIKVKPEEIPFRKLIGKTIVDVEVKEFHLTKENVAEWYNFHCSDGSCHGFIAESGVSFQYAHIQHCSEEDLNERLLDANDGEETPEDEGVD